MTEQCIKKEIENMKKDLYDKYSVFIFSNIIGALLILFCFLFINSSSKIFFILFISSFEAINILSRLFCSFIIQDFVNLSCAKKGNFKIVNDKIKFIKLETKVVRKEYYARRRHVPEKNISFNKIMFENTKLNFIVSKYKDFMCDEDVQIWVSTDNNPRIIHIVPIKNKV